MPDREKVIKELDKLVDEVNPWKESPPLRCDISYPLLCDTLALLKEQEAVKPKKVKGYNPPMYTIYEYECEKCKSPMMIKQPFCMGCGRPVKWE